MNFLIINLRYPFGKNQIYLNLSTAAVAAQVFALGHMVKIFDLNIDKLEADQIRSADVVGISVFGAAYIPGAIELLRFIRRSNPRARLIVGGQTAEKLDREDFLKIFGDDVVQGNPDGLSEVLGCQVEEIPAAEEVSFRRAWEAMGETKLVEYLKREGTLFVSQGCRFNCDFCAACKNQPERFRDLGEFEADLLYLAAVAKSHGLSELSFYATSLDFFQTPETVRKYLEVLARINKKSGIRIRLRCLASMTSFLRAARETPEFGVLLKRAGLWCVGFGVDGSDAVIWRAQGKRHNSESDIDRCLKTCRDININAELLMVFGFPEETLRTIIKTVVPSLSTIGRRKVIVRPYLAKPAVPGNRRWAEDKKLVRKIIENPDLFYNIDFCAIGSTLTHPNLRLRWTSNLVYLLICGLLTPIGKNTTSPLLPQGENGWYGRLAKVVNRLMPFDR